MKQPRIFIGAIILIWVAGLLGFSKIDDFDVIKKIGTQLASWSSDNPQEKVYLHLDKPYYAIGDDIWFKAYITTGAEHKLSVISGILNVELINAKDSITKAIKVPLTAGMGWGSIKLVDSLKEGNYRIRAYTKWMRNTSDEYFFDTTIQVGNSISNIVFTKASYTYATTPNNQQKVSATINYADINGNPYAGKDVSYEVQLNLRDVAKGHGITNNAGIINLTFINTMPALQKSGNITTHIKIDKKLLAITKIVPVKATSQKIDVKFFPESGYMVSGVRSKIAFKVVGANGLGVDVRGSIIDNQNKVVIDIETQHLGMGAFTITPEAGKTYAAKLVYPDGSTNTVNLPSASDRGYVLSVYNTDTDNILVTISLSQTTFKENENAEINMVAQSGGNIVYATKTKLESTSFISRIPRSRFATGIVQFTLFSAKGDALNERIFFVQNPDKLNLKLSTTKTTYAPREKVKLDIEAKDSNTQPIIGAFSVSVIDESKVPVDESDESTILSNILLTSDIKGYIEKPNYYFTNVSDKTKADLDILMLTQGYRRFEWKQIMANNFQALAFTPEKSLNITGHIKTRSGKPIPYARVTMLSTTGGMFFMDTVADDHGRFAFHDLVFTDSVKFVIQSRTQKDRKNVEIELDDIQPQLIARNKNTPDIEVNISSAMAPYLLNSKKQYDELLKYGLITRSNFLKEITITEKKNKVQYSDNLNGVGRADYIITSDELGFSGSLALSLAGKIPGVYIKGNQAYSVRSMNMAGPQPMAIVLDGIVIPNDDKNILDDINPDNVQSVEVLKSISYTVLYGSRGANGILVITTKRGGDIKYFERYAPGIVTYKPVGYQRIKEFYSPQYDDPKTNAKIADLRTTIYWQPHILTDKSGNASIQYFNADTPGNYRAVIEGIDADGNVARQVYRYKVQ